MICLDSLMSYRRERSSSMSSQLVESSSCKDASDNLTVLLEDEEGSANDDDDMDIGCVSNCGHVFHVACWEQWNEMRCPNCNQKATLFTKLFISAPPLPSRQAGNAIPSSVPQQPVKNEDEKDDDDDNNDHEEEEERQVLLDMRTAEQGGMAKAIQKVVALKAGMRKMRRQKESTESELKSTRLVLELTQEELDLATQELDQQREKISNFNAKFARLQSQHWSRHGILRDALDEKHEREIRALRKELDQAKSDLVLRNRQLAHWTGNAFLPSPIASGGRTRFRVRFAEGGLEKPETIDC